MRRALRSFSTVLIVAGALLLTDAIVTLVWQEPVTALSAKLHQDSLARDLKRLQAVPPSALEVKALGGLHSTRRRVAFQGRALDRRLKRGDAAGRILIPKIGIDFVVVKGSDPADLRKGPGIYDDMSFPGVPGTTAIAGHRTTYLAPFRRLDELRPGNTIELKMPYATLTYSVQETKIVQAQDLGVLIRRPYDRLVLTACHPLFSAAQRIVVFARLVHTVPKGAAAR